MHSGILYMKKINKRYRNNNNNNNSSSSAIYSLNYKFDSNSIAGKISGTALDLIKRYNDLAKDAHSNNDYVTAEIFRQYAEHYRKIVTEINERKNAREQQDGNMNTVSAAAEAATQQTAVENEEKTDSENNKTIVQSVTETKTVLETEKTKVEETQEQTQKEPVAETTIAEKKPARKTFHVIEINKTQTDEAQAVSDNTPTVKPRRTYRRKTVAAAPAAEA